MPDAFLMVLDAALRSTVLLGLVALTAWLLRHGPAAGRYRVWACGLGGMLIMPLVVRAVPAWNVRMDGVPSALRATVTTPSPQRAQARATGDSVTVPAVSERPSVAPTRDRGLVVASFVWMGGVVVLAAWLFAGWFRAHRLRRRALAVSDEAMLKAARDAAHQLGLSTLPALLFADGIAVPLVCGWFRPAVLLPGSVLRWPEHDVRAALLHELAHVRRRDGLGQFTSALVLCLYWFHPASWLAVGALAAEREAACDEVVLRAGIEPFAYADQLLAMARRVGEGASPRAVMAMARPRALERRLSNVLRWVPHSNARNRVWHFAAGPVVVALITALGALRVVPPSSASAALVDAPLAPGPTLRAEASDAPDRRRSAATPDPEVAAIVAPRALAASATSTSSGAVPVTRLRVPTRQGVCGYGVPNEITFSRTLAAQGGSANCRTGPAILEFRVRDGVLEDVDVTVGGTDSLPVSTGAPADLTARLLHAAAVLAPGAAARAAQAAALIDGPDVTDQLLALARRPEVGPVAQRMSVVWAEIVGRTRAHDALLALLRDESVDVSVREQAVIALGSVAIAPALELARGSPSYHMRGVAAHRLALVLPVDELLALYPTLPDEESRRGLVDRIAERGSPAQRAQFASVFQREPNGQLRGYALERIGRQ